MTWKWLTRYGTKSDNVDNTLTEQVALQALYVSKGVGLFTDYSIKTQQ